MSPSLQWKKPVCQCHGCWQETRASRVRDNTAYCSQPQPEYHHFGISSCPPCHMGRWEEGQVTAAHALSCVRRGDPQLREPTTFIACGASAPELQGEPELSLHWAVSNPPFLREGQSFVFAKATCQTDILKRQDGGHEGPWKTHRHAGGSWRTACQRPDGNTYHRHLV